jgi:hypothetical protein
MAATLRAVAAVASRMMNDEKDFRLLKATRCAIKEDTFMLLKG